MHYPEIKLLIAGLDSREAKYNSKADLWSAGCIFYEMLCNRNVLTANNGHVVDVPSLVAQLADEMRNKRGKPLPKQIVASDKSFLGPASDYNDESTESCRECRTTLARAADVDEAKIHIMSAKAARKGTAQHRAGKVTVMYQLDIEPSKECEELLARMLTHRPDDRISWEEFFDYKWLGLRPEEGIPNSG